MTGQEIKYVNSDGCVGTGSNLYTSKNFLQQRRIDRGSGLEIGASATGSLFIPRLEVPEPTLGQLPKTGVMLYLYGLVLSLIEQPCRLGSGHVRLLAAERCIYLRDTYRLPLLS